MKNTSLKYIGIFVVIVLVVLLVALKSSNAPTSDMQNGSVAGQPQGTLAPTTQSKTASAPKTTTVNKAPISSGNYVDYVTQLRANQSACATAANAQFSHLYGSSLQTSAVSTYFNTVNGNCYAQLTGKSQAAYSTSTTGYLYFRNISANVALLQCVDPTGTMYADSNWTCTNKLTGKSISKAEYNATIASDTTQ